MSAENLIARPGDPDLDCHLTGLRLVSVVEPPATGYHAEVTLGFDDGMTLGYGQFMRPGDEILADMQVATLRQWRDEGAEIELTSAPGKWTLLQSGTDRVAVPRKAPPGGYHVIAGDDLIVAKDDRFGTGLDTWDF